MMRAVQCLWNFNTSGIIYQFERVPALPPRFLGKDIYLIDAFGMVNALSFSASSGRGEYKARLGDAMLAA